MTSPKVSVIVPVFNSERFIGEALGSLRLEREVELNIIVVDDGSTDGSIGIVKTLAQKDPRIQLLAGEHRGISAARNVGVRAATSDYITFLDSDDICPPGRIGRQLHRLRSHPDAEAIIGESLWFEALTPDLEPVAGTRHLRMICVHLHSALFVCSVFNTYGHFDETLEFAEDLDFFLRLLEADAKIIVEDEIASLYRRHENNSTRSFGNTRQATMAALQRSIARRRKAGSNKPLASILARRFAGENVFNSTA
jgi:glycosyltransferase involved in cell wall biosynthesis